MKNSAFKKTILIIMCLSFSLGGLFACNIGGENVGPPQNIYVPAESVEVPQPSPILGVREIGELPPHPELPPPQDGIAPYLFGEGSRLFFDEEIGDEGDYRPVFEIERKDNTFTVEYDGLSSWDFFYVDVANWQPEYSYIAVYISGNPLGSLTQITMAAAYAEMEQRPLVPIIVDTLRTAEQKIFTDIASFKTISPVFVFEEYLLIDQTINRLFFFVDSNPAQGPANTSGKLTFEIDFGQHHQQRPMLLGDTDPTLSIPQRYNWERDEYDNVAVRPTSNDIEQMRGAYVEFPLEYYVHQGSMFTELSVSFFAVNLRSVTIAAVFEGGEAAWSDVVLLHTINNTYDGQYASWSDQLLNGLIGETISFARARVVYDDDLRSPVRLEQDSYVLLREFRITHLRFYINSGIAFFAPGTNTTMGDHLIHSSQGVAGSPPPDVHPILTINEVDFLLAEDDGIRIGQSWFLGPATGAHFVTLRPQTIEPGGIGTVSVSGAGGWNWWAMPIMNHTHEYNVITIRFRGPAGRTRMGVHPVRRDRVSGGDLIDSESSVVSSAWFAFDRGETVMDESNWYRSVEYDPTTNIYTFTIDLYRQFNHHFYPYRDLEFGNPDLEIVQLRFYHTTPPGNPAPGNFDIEFLGVEFSQSTFVSPRS